MNNVAILLSTFNGEEYLPTQLKSLKNQKNVKISIFVIDDSSTDNTVKILEKCDLDIKILRRKGHRSAEKNFIELIHLVPSYFDYYCFCDQDDYWLKSKLSYSIYKLKSNNAHLAGSRTFIGNENLKIFEVSKNFKKFSFKNSIVQSIAGGNTMVWTNKFLKFLKGLNHSIVASHDWYLYQMSFLYGYKFIFISKPTIIYRQHKNNLVGYNLGFKNILIRIIKGLTGRYKYWHELNKNHLIINIDKNNIIKENLETAKFFYIYRKRNIIKGIFQIFIKLKIRRQYLFENFLLIVAILIKKV